MFLLSLLLKQPGLSNSMAEEPSNHTAVDVPQEEVVRNVMPGLLDLDGGRNKKPSTVKVTKEVNAESAVSVEETNALNTIAPPNQGNDSSCSDKLHS